MPTTEHGTSEGPAHLDELVDAIGPHLEPHEIQTLVRERAERTADPLEELRRVRALSELLTINEERAVERASSVGRTQREIADALGKPQTQVHRILRRARLSEQARRASAREFILQYKAGAISEGMMLGLLSGASEGRSAQGQEDDGYSRDDWDEIRSAYMSGLLSEAQYEDLRKSKTGASGRRRR